LRTGERVSESCAQAQFQGRAPFLLLASCPLPPSLVLSPGRRPVLTFFQLGLIEALCRALPAATPTPTPLQAMAIPALIEGRDLITLAPNGTGKKVAWALAMLQRLCVPMMPAAPGAPRGLVLVNDAEHAVAAHQHLAALTRFVPIEHAIAGAGASRALRTGLEVLIATAEQALELEAQGALSFDAIEFVVVDEAERTVGPRHRAALDLLMPKLPDCRQTAMFASEADADLGAIAQAMLIDAEAIRHVPSKPHETLGQPLWLDAVPEVTHPLRQSQRRSG